MAYLVEIVNLVVDFWWDAPLAFCFDVIFTLDRNRTAYYIIAEPRRKIPSTLAAGVVQT